MHKLFTPLLALTISFCASHGVPGQDPQQDPNQKNPQLGKQQAGTPLKHAMLGIAVEPLPPQLRNQLPSLRQKEQGVLVGAVTKDSPADKAGLKPNDILMSYDVQKLYSPDQLIKLVRDDSPGKEVTLHYIRDGKEATAKVSLGEFQPGQFQPTYRSYRFPEAQPLPVAPRPRQGDDATIWESFDAMKLTRLDNNRWRAEIEYRSKDGKKEHKTFEGTRDEIRKSIQAEKDLPANERRHLLRSLNVERMFEGQEPQ
jgi:hypothetical protein